MFDIKHKITIYNPADKLYSALTTLTSIQGIVGWWIEDVEEETCQGKIRLKFEKQCNKKYKDILIQVSEIDPGKRISWNVLEGPKEWLGTAIQFDLVAQRHKTLVRFTHKYWRTQTDFCVQCSTQWAIFLLSLKDFVEKGSGLTVPTDVKIDTPALSWA